MKFLASMETSTDKVERVTWLTPKPSKPESKIRLYLYIGIDEGKHIHLRLKLNNVTSGLNFTKALALRIDDVLVRIPLGLDDVDREYHGNTNYEYIDIPAEEHLATIAAMAMSKDTVVRLVGSDGYTDRKLMDDSKRLLYAVLLVYRHLLEERASRQ